MSKMKKLSIIFSLVMLLVTLFVLSSCECKHEYGQWVTTKKPTCKDTGIMERVCTLCYEKVTAEVPADSEAHSYGEWIIDSEPTCTTAGAKHKVCSLCNDTKEESIGANKDNHTFGEWVVETEATCSKDGKKVRECPCSEKETAIIPKLTEGGHTYGEWAISIEPTCSEEGQRIRYCIDCEKPQAEKLSPLDEGGHSYGEWQTVTEPTCSSVGEQTRDCVYCDNVEKGEIPILTSGGHSFGEWTTTTEPTCSTEGEQKRECTLCGNSEVEPLSKLDEGGHSYGNWQETIKPTCDTVGEKQRVCVLCGDTEKEEVARLPIIYTITLDIEGEITVINLPEDGIYNLPTPIKLGYNFVGWKDGERDFNASGIVTESKEITAKFELAKTLTFNELKTRIDGGVDTILLASDIVLTDTIYVTGDTTILSEGNYTLTRDKDFLGELFVLGEDNLGNNLILKDKKATLTIKPEENTSIVIDGNKSNLTEKVTGTVFFMTNGCVLNIYDGVTIQNHKKLGNDKIYVEKYAFDENELVGGSVALINDGTFNMYGGTVKDNEVNPYYSGFVNEEDKIEGYKNGSYGGAIYNAGVFNMYGGTFENNLASYGGAFFNTRELNIQGGTLNNNIATAYGGAIFSANGGASITYLGSSEGDITENKIFFNGNTAKGGGAIYMLYNCSTVIYGNTVFDSNKADVTYDGKEAIGLNGGAICSTGELVIYHAEFKNNEARYYGGGIYVAYTNEDKVPRVNDIKSAIFENNTAKGGAGIMVSSTKATIGNVKAVGNKATTKGGGFAYLSGGAELNIASGEIKNNICDNASGGAFYLSGSKLNLQGAEDNRIIVTDNTTVENGGVICAYIQTDEIVKGQDEEGNDIIETISTRSTVNISYVDFKNNTSTTKSPYGGGAIYSSNTDVTVDNSIFELNSAIYGGAISLFSGSIFKGDVLSFVNNVADANGGVMYTSKSTVELSNITLSDNSAKGYTKVTETVNEETGETETTETVVTGNGGAFYINSTSTFTGTNIVATGNSAGNGGFMYGAYSVITISGDSEFTKNTATSEASQEGGGAFYLSDCTGEIKDAKINENTASNGGAIAIFKSKDDTFKITNCTFDKNTVTSTGGTFYINTSNVLIDGCTVTESSSDGNGGAVYSTTATVDISKTTFEKNNSSGGGVFYLTKSTFTSTDDKYLENTSKYGTYYVNSSSTLTVNNGTMNSNTANFGACIYLKSGNIIINGLEANDNISSKGNGGAINIGNGENTINNATFTGNKATYDNADCYGGAISVNGGATLTLNNSVFQNNQAVKGGAIALVNGTLTINGITASGNVATGYTDGTAKKGGNGGAIYIGTGTFTLNKGTAITENTFTENVAQSGGGAIYCFETNADIIIEQITLTNNEATGNYGGGLYVRGKATTGDNTISVDIGTVTATGNYGSNGGAIYLYRLEKAEIDSIVANNNSSTNGGAIYIAGGAIVDIGELSGSGNSASTNGGFAYIGTSTTTIHGGTVGENDDQNGRELYFSAKVSINTENFTYPEGGINDATKIVAITE